MSPEVLYKRMLYSVQCEVRNSPEIQQGRFWCVLCDKVLYRIGWDIMELGWPSCCEHKMDLVPAHNVKTFRYHNHKRYNS